MMSEFESFETAYRTFRLKYDCVPGDCPTAKAQALGFTVNTQTGTTPNGNGLIDALAASAQITSLHGEENMFWSWLSDAKLIPYDLETATVPSWNNIPGLGTLDGTRRYVPESRVKSGNFYHVASYNVQTYIRSGMSLLGDSSASSRPILYGAPFEAAQARYVYTKVGGDDIRVNSVVNTGPPPNGKVNLGSRSYFATWNWWYVDPTTASPNTGVTPCVIDTAGVYTWSTLNTAACNIFWRID